MSDEFYDAAVFGDLQKLSRMVEADPAIVHSRVEFEFTALHGVAGEEQLEAAEYLLDHGADPNARNDEGIAPLHAAAYPEMAELLVRRGADINARSNDGSTPLIVHAAEAERCDVMKTLLELGADVTAKDKWGQSALDIARQREEEDKVVLLQEHGAV
jgi:ankyrin repeat protein